ncbi:MAG: alternative ribosome rescue aminoacyl-tRNA hydrolase ArfB [Chloroflexi bacterium]|nr:alternative ribosome rescue aminoacyl-tRNA hydrolase ArfB [Chloroflexota bacterium]
MIQVTPSIAIDESEISEEFVRAAGPGGQNVNKVSTAVQLRFDVLHSPALPEDVRARLIRLAGKRMTDEGVIVILAKQHRTQLQNRAEATTQLIELIRRAADKPKPRHKTRPTLASKQRRLEGKKQRSEIKQTRTRRPRPDE